MFKSFFKNDFWFLFLKICCFTFFTLYWKILTWGKNPYSWSLKKLIFVSICIQDILGWKFLWVIKGWRWRFQNWYKRKKNYKSKCTEKYLVFIIWVSDYTIISVWSYIFEKILVGMNIFHRLKAIGLRIKCPAARRGERGAFLPFYL